MSDNCFVSTLTKLRKSSKNSIDSIEPFDDFKKYMHIERNVEKDLKSLLKKVNESKKKTLILVCGSAGDGKSHILSHLKNDEEILGDYSVLNDATESDSPKKTAMDTLNSRLEPFKDSNIDKDGKNIIIAINLGILNKFIVSDYGKEYSQLKKYVEEKILLDKQNDDTIYNLDSPFQHINFSDYHMFTLAEDGIHPSFILNLIDKIVENSDENPFFADYKKNCANCEISSKCPIKDNYEYLMDEKVKNSIANLLVKVNLVDKHISTTRDILDFFYNILVSPNFSKKDIFGLAQKSRNYLSEYLTQITPTLLFSSAGVTQLMTIMSHHDPLLDRSKEKDEHTLNYYIHDSVKKDLNSSFETTIYAEKLCSDEFIQIIDNDYELKRLVYNTIVRNTYLSVHYYDSELYKNYISLLYYYNARKKSRLKQYYSLIEDGVIQWCGKDEDKNVCINNDNKSISLYEKIEFNSDIGKLKSIEDKELERFSTYFIASFKNSNVLNVDYTLFEMLNKLKQGYIQTAEDRNNHADFIGFINEMSNKNKTNELIIKKKNFKAVLRDDPEFGFEFEVIRL